MFKFLLVALVTLILSIIIINTKKLKTFGYILLVISLGILLFFISPFLLIVILSFKFIAIIFWVILFIIAIK
jgi:hypothetical protein